MAAYFVYILASGRNGTLYVGVTNDLVRRTHEHRIGAVDGFAKSHDAKRLVYFESFPDVHDAMRREKVLKRWRREWKLNLIERENPDWHDLYEGIAG